MGAWIARLRNFLVRASLPELANVGGFANGIPDAQERAAFLAGALAGAGAR